MDSKIQLSNQDQPTIQQEQPAVQFRVIVVGIVQNEFGEYLICKMPKGRGVFPDQWGLLMSYDLSNFTVRKVDPVPALTPQGNFI